MKYRIEITHRARKALRRLPTRVQHEIDGLIILLSHNPRPEGAQKMRGYKSTYRAWVGDAYRIVWEIHEGRLLVLIIRIGPRGDVYKGMP